MSRIFRLTPPVGQNLRSRNALRKPWLFGRLRNEARIIPVGHFCVGLLLRVMAHGRQLIHGALLRNKHNN